MADVNRINPDYFVEHHAVTQLWEDKSKAWLAQWFSDNGFVRGYASNPNNWNGLINPFTGQRSYAQAHCVGQRVTSATPDATDAERAAGYRVFWIVADPYGVITYGAGNWNINRRAINCENLGDYRNYALRDGDCKVMADFWRPRDKELGGATVVVGHQEVSDQATACPSRIMEGIPTIVNYINNPPQPPKPQKPPVITTKTVTRDETIPFKQTTQFDPLLPVGEEKITQKGVNGVQRITTTITYSDGVEIKREDTQAEVIKQPVDEVKSIGTLPVTPPPTPTPGQDAASWLASVWEWIKKMLSKFTFKP